MTTITLTSKGQVTLPIAVRRALGLKASEKLEVSFDEQTREIVLRKQGTVEDATKTLRSLPRNNVPPLADAHEYYATERTTEVTGRG